MSTAYQEWTTDEYLRGLVPESAMMPCPFHDDADPSAHVLPGSGYLHCFVCGYTLTPVGVAAKLMVGGGEPSGRDYRHAEEWLERIGRARSPLTVGKGGAAIAAAVRPEPASDLALLAMSLFCRLANGLLARRPDVRVPLALGRGLRDPVKLGLGLADPALVGRLDELMLRETPLWLAEPGRREATLIQAGIWAPATPAKPVRYRLRDRLILPEWRRGHPLGTDGEARVVYYQARRRDEAEPDAGGTKVPKYLSPPLPRQLWGVETLKRTNTPAAWVCEGVFDALPLAEAGEAVVATLGVDLGRWGDEALRAALGDRPTVLAYDRDAAGVAKAAELQERLAQAGVPVLTLPLPAGVKDLSEWATRDGVDALIAAAYLRL